MLVGQEQPDSGQLKLGETVQTMYVDQSREALQSERSVKLQAFLAEAGCAFFTSLILVSIPGWSSCIHASLGRCEAEPEMTFAEQLFELAGLTTHLPANSNS